MKRNLTLVCLLLTGMLLQFCRPQVAVQKPIAGAKAPAQNEKPAPFGVNLAGAEFGSNIPGLFNKDYVYPSAIQLDYFKSKGLTLVRMPFKWDRVQPVLNGELDQLELARMKAFVEAAQERNIWVLLDMHNYGRRHIGKERYIIGATEVPVATVADAWERLAKEFKGYSNIWGYGLMNEPHDMLDSTPWFTIAQACISSIRKHDTKTTIVVGGDSWSSAERWLEFSDNLRNLNDPSRNLIFEAHVYFDSDASGTYKTSYEAEGATPTTGITRVTPFIDWLKKHNFRGFIGEYGVPDNDPRWLLTLDNFLQHLEVNGINGTYWAAGPWWGKYVLAVEPREGQDRPQMKTLEKYKFATTDAR